MPLKYTLGILAIAAGVFTVALFLQSPQSVESVHGPVVESARTSAVHYPGPVKFKAPMVAEVASVSSEAAVSSGTIRTTVERPPAPPRVEALISEYATDPKGLQVWLESLRRADLNEYLDLRAEFKEYSGWDADVYGKGSELYASFFGVLNGAYEGVLEVTDGTSVAVRWVLEMKADGNNPFGRHRIWIDFAGGQFVSGEGTMRTSRNPDSLGVRYGSYILDVLIPIDGESHLAGSLFELLPAPEAQKRRPYRLVGHLKLKRR